MSCRYDTVYTMKLILLLGLVSIVDNCEQIKTPMCKRSWYNYTSMPNRFNHETQDEAGLEVHQYWPLVEIKCSDVLNFFICSLYVPICMEDYAGSVPPCRSVCERSKTGCEPILKQYGFKWPDALDCELFPWNQTTCIDETATMPWKQSNFTGAKLLSVARDQTEEPDNFNYSIVTKLSFVTTGLWRFCTRFLTRVIRLIK